MARDVCATPPSAPCGGWLLEVGAYGWVPRSHPQEAPWPPHVSHQQFPALGAGKLTGTLPVWSWDRFFS